MRPVSADLRNQLFNMGLYPTNPPTCLVQHVELVPGYPDIEITIPNITNVSISTHESNFCQTCTFTICNVNPEDPTDLGYFTPHRDDEYYAKPKNEWWRVLVPGTTRIKVYMGYGDEQVLCFYGFIDSTTVTMGANESTMSVTCRDVGKILVDQTCNSIDNSVFGWNITYPIGDTVTEAYLLKTNTDPLLEDIVKDICVRAGFIEQDVECDSTGMRLSDTLEGFFEFEDMTWDACINKIKDLTIFEFWINEEGKAQFRYPKSKVISVVDEQVCMFATDPQELEHATASYYTLVVKDMADPTIIYRNGVDFIFDEATNTITRVEGEALPEDAWVLVSYTYLSWIFRNGLNIIQLPLTMTHDNIYATIRVCGEGGTTGGIEASVQVAADNTLWDGSKILANKVLVYTNENLLDEAACLTVANRMALDMLDRYTQVNFLAIPIPMLQLRDIVQVLTYGLIHEAYIVIGQNLTYTADQQKITQQVMAYHYAYTPYV